MNIKLSTVEAFSFAGQALIIHFSEPPIVTRLTKIDKLWVMSSISHDKELYKYTTTISGSNHVRTWTVLNLFRQIPMLRICFYMLCWPIKKLKRLIHVPWKKLVNLYPFFPPLKDCKDTKAIWKIFFNQVKENRWTECFLVGNEPGQSAA